jgi:hypothetical protein
MFDVTARDYVLTRMCQFKNTLSSQIFRLKNNDIQVSQTCVTLRLRMTTVRLGYGALRYL